MSAKCVPVSVYGTSVVEPARICNISVRKVDDRYHVVLILACI